MTDQERKDLERKVAGKTAALQTFILVTGLNMSSSTVAAKLSRDPRRAAVEGNTTAIGRNTLRVGGQRDPPAKGRAAASADQAAGYGAGVWNLQGEGTSIKEGRSVMTRTMIEFVEQHFDKTAPPFKEGERLLPLIEAAGFKTTLGSVRQAITTIRRRQGLSSKRSIAQKKTVVQQNPRAMTLTNYVDDALKGLTLLKTEIKRLQEIEKKYLAIKAQIEK